MSSVQRVRVGNDINVIATVKRSGVTLNWSDVRIIKVSLYSRAQRLESGLCQTMIDKDDPTLLHVKYRGTDSELIGVNNLALTFRNRGFAITKDVPVVEFVSNSASSDRNNPIHVTFNL